MKATKLPEPKIIGTITAKDLDGKIVETYEIIERTFFAKTLRLDSAERKRVNKNFIHSNTLEEYKFALRIQSTGGTLGYRTSAEAINAASNLAKPKEQKKPFVVDSYTRNLICQIIASK